MLREFYGFRVLCLATLLKRREQSIDEGSNKTLPDLGIEPDRVWVAELRVEVEVKGFRVQAAFHQLSKAMRRTCISRVGLEAPINKAASHN